MKYTKKAIKSLIIQSLSFIVWFFLPTLITAQSNYDSLVDKVLLKTLNQHKELVSIPNLPKDKDLMEKNIQWVADQYNRLDFDTTLLPSSTLPILLAQKIFDPNFKTVLFYFHIDGQPVNPESWNQSDPFKPVLKEKDANGDLQIIEWNKLDKTIDDEWRIFARAAADDKAPIIMLLSAFQILKDQNVNPNFNVKVIFDPEEEYGSQALLSTIETYKGQYASDYFIVMDGPAHPSNKPTITFGCRGITFCSITTFGSKLPQHSGHFRNYTPNPVFSLGRLLSTMKDENGKVLIKDFYKGIQISNDDMNLLNSIPFNSADFNTNLGIHSAEKVGGNYQQSLQYPSLNVRQIGTSWEGNGLKTVIPSYATAHIDVRLVPETDKVAQLVKIENHIEQQGYYVIDREPTDEERMNYPKIVKFITSPGVNAFRTNPFSHFGQLITQNLASDFGEEPIKIRIMGGTVPIVPLINSLDVPTIIVPMVNMDNNQHSPNENIRIGNIRQGIKTCLSILNTTL